MVNILASHAGSRGSSPRIGNKFNFFVAAVLFAECSGLSSYLAEPETTVCCYINTAAWAYHKHHRTLLEYATRLQLLKGKARMTSIAHFCCL